MKYLNKKMIFSFLLGSVITAGLTVTAFTITAKEVTYSPKNPNWKVDNTKDAIDYLYKLTDYEVPANTYFYDNTTEGANIQRYKKVNNEYYKCDQYGTIIDNKNPVKIDATKLVEYKAETVNNMSKGTAGYASKNFLLGNGLDILNATKESYNKGYLDGQAHSNPGNAKITYHYHQHTDACRCHGHGEVHGYGHTCWDCNWIGLYCSSCGERYDYAVRNDDGSYVSPGWYRLLEMSEEDAWTYGTGNPNNICGKIMCGKNSNTIESATIDYE